MLDPLFQQLIEQSQSSNRTPLLNMSLQEKREGYRERYLARGLPSAIDVTSEDIVIEHNSNTISSRVYRPAEQTPTPSPLIVYFHGGGFALGDVATYDHQSQQLANRTQATVLSIDYRMAPESKFPAAVQDGIDSLLWAFETDSLNIDISKILVAGDSAGGSMAITASMAAAKAGKTVLCQVLLYPVVDWRPSFDLCHYQSINDFGTGFFLDKSLLDWFAAQYLSAPEEALNPAVSPILSKELSILPPSIIITAGHDPLRDMGKDFAEKLKTCKVTVDHINYDTMIHNFLGYTGLVPQAEVAFNDICKLIQEKIAYSSNVLPQTQ